jgi:4-aminobutyrate aminotransferase / (S)-3-amino-2-methylpropionate transaminase / 5-aminovalerate transaminase
LNATPPTSRKIELRTEIPGPRSREVVAWERQHLAPGLQAFAQWANVAMARGAGSTLTDVDGNTYVDLIGGIGVNALGHGHPRHVEAIAAQARALVVGSFTSEPRAALVNAVCELAPPGLDRLQLYSSGAEAVESALRLARCATGRREVIGFWGGFHGKTAGAAALMGSTTRETLGPLPAGATSVPYADCYRCPFQLRYPSCGLACAEFARKALRRGTAGPVAAMVVEPMQGTAGNVVPPDDFLPAIASAAREVGALLVADEMITGFGRTGKPWGVDHSGARPDVVTIGKGLGSGFPVSGVLARDAVARAKPWSEPSGASSSYGGNALASAAALATVATIREERLWENAERVGAAMVAELRRMQERQPLIGDVRGAGLLIGIELVKDRTTREPLDTSFTRRIFEECLRRGLLAMAYTPHVRLQPALTIDEGTALEGLAVLDEVLGELTRGGGWR